MDGTVNFLLSPLTRPGDLVKAKLQALGLRPVDVAREAQISQQRMTAILKGDSRNRALQERVVHAARGLTGVRRLDAHYVFGMLAARKGKAA